MQECACLGWHQGDECVRPLVGAVRSCTAVSESFDAFNRLAAALAKSQDRRASSRGFCFWLKEDGEGKHDASHRAMMLSFFFLPLGFPELTGCLPKDLGGVGGVCGFRFFLGFFRRLDG